MEEQKNTLTLLERQYDRMLDTVREDTEALTASMLETLRREHALEGMLSMLVRSAQRKESEDDFAACKEKWVATNDRIFEMLLLMSDFRAEFEARFKVLREYLFGEDPEEETEDDADTASDTPAEPESEKATIGFIPTQEQK